MTVVLDDQAVVFLAQRTHLARAILERLRDDWPPRVLATSLVELPGSDSIDAFLRACVIVCDIPVPLARQAARLRSKAGVGTVADALAVAYSQGRTLVSGHDAVASLAAVAHDVCLVTV